VCVVMFLAAAGSYARIETDGSVTRPMVIGDPRPANPSFSRRTTLIAYFTDRGPLRERYLTIARSGEVFLGTPDPPRSKDLHVRLTTARLRRLRKHIAAIRTYPYSGPAPANADAPPAPVVPPGHPGYSDISAGKYSYRAEWQRISHPDGETSRRTYGSSAISLTARRECQTRDPAADCQPRGQPPHEVRVLLDELQRLAQRYVKPRR
jgi:hypothetical protein